MQELAGSEVRAIPTLLKVNILTRFGTVEGGFSCTEHLAYSTTKLFARMIPSYELVFA